MSVTLKNNFFANARAVTFEDANGITWSINSGTNQITAAYSGSGSAGAANPTAKVGLAAVNGSAATFMRSDAAPPIDQTITPTWTGKHTFSVVPAINGLSWTAVSAFLNSWVNFGSPFAPAGYYKDPTGRVYLRGLVKSGTVGQAIFQLPAGYRPPYQTSFPVVSNDLFGEVYVDTSGNVVLFAGSNSSVYLESVSFATF